MPVVSLDYIEVDDRGIAKLIGSRIKVMHLVMAQRAEGYSAEQLLEQYPHLEPEKIYAALAYYHANKATIDRQIEESIRFADEMRAKHPNPFTRAELLVQLSPADRERLTRESEYLATDESSES